ncbi:MAG TPA: PA14 domain-containing protein [Candidatus Paceibacterota bacterium]|nr:PA14 domain-containing protein [Candidatus Paceibacterota bacterium]
MTPIDGPSLAPLDAGNLDDGLIGLTGFLAIREAGRKTFTCASDDGAMVWIGNRLVIDNDGVHATPGDGAEGTAFFSEPGLYPIEIAWFNSDWIDDVGGHGGASLQFTCNGAAIPTADCYPDQAAGLRIRMPASAVVVEWVGDDILQSAPTALGPWTDVSGALGSYTTPPREAAAFYRLRGERRDHVIQPGQGVEVMQVSFGDQVSGPQWGRVVANPRVLTRSTAIIGGFLNVFTAKGWAIQNMPVPLTDQPSSAKYFDLGSPGFRGPITIAELKIIYSNSLIAQPREVVDNLDFTPFPAAAWVWNATGLGPPVDLVPGTPPTTYGMEDIDLVGKETFARYQLVTNEQTAKNQSWPMAMANCIAYWWHTGTLRFLCPAHEPGLKGDHSLVGQLDTAFDRVVRSRCSGDGVCVKQAFDGRIGGLNRCSYVEDYLSDYVYTMHQGVGAVCGVLPYGSYHDYWGDVISACVGDAPTWEWVRDWFNNRYTVEALIAYGGGGGHAVRVTGYGMTAGKPWIRYSHDAQQCNDAAGLENVVVELSDPDRDDFLNIDGTDDEIVMFVAMSYYYW